MTKMPEMIIHLIILLHVYISNKTMKQKHMT